MKNIVLQPTFYDKFQCIGGKCKNTCCYGWKIIFSKEEFKNIKRKIKSEEFAKIYQDAFVVEKKSQTYNIKFNEEGNCKFLDKDGLCLIYKEVGPENMSTVCQTFPRRCFRYLDSYECFLSIGCEEVVRLLLKEKDGILLEVKEKELSKALKNSVYNTILKDKYYDDIRILLLRVLQNRNYSFGERMVLLGMAFQRIESMIKENEFKNIPKYVERFLTDMNKNKKVYESFFNSIEKSNKRAIRTLIYHLKDKNDNTLKKIKQKIENRLDVVRKIKINKEKSEMTIEFNSEKYKEAEKEFELFLKGKEYYIENVMLEGFLVFNSPFRIPGGIWKNYCAMTIIYSTFLFMLTCYLDKDSTDEDFVYCVSQVARTLFNNSEYVENLEKHLEETQSDTLAHIAVLVL